MLRKKNTSLRKIPLGGWYLTPRLGAGKCPHLAFVARPGTAKARMEPSTLAKLPTDNDMKGNAKDK